jgi:hypothetical protein
MKAPQVGAPYAVFPPPVVPVVPDWAVRFPRLTREDDFNTPAFNKGAITLRAADHYQAGHDYRFNWSTQHKLEIVQPASRSLESFGAVH